MFGGGRGAPILVLKQNVQRETGRKVQIGNIKAGKTIADVIRTCLGPKAMLKMLMDPMGGICMTNDGNAILREINVQHPAAKSLIEIARTQDEEVGDGTTSVIVLAGEMLNVAEPLILQQERVLPINRGMHPTVIIRGYRKALDDLINIFRDEISIEVDTSNEDEMRKIVESSIGTKFVNRWLKQACNMALEAVKIVASHTDKDIDIKRYAKVEKVPGGDIEDSKVLNGIMINKDIVHPRMRRKIENPRIVLLDCNLEYKKGESQTSIEILNEGDFAKILQLEEEAIGKMCQEIIEVKPDLVLTEKGCADLAQHLLAKAGISVVRRVRKSDNNRIARVTGATIVSRTDELSPEHVGTECGLFEIRKMGDEYFAFFVECKNPSACTILLRGPSKEVLMEVERNLQDAMHVNRNVILEGRIVPGGGAAEMAASAILQERVSTNAEGLEQWAYKAVASALEIIPITLLQNCGANTIRALTALRAKHTSVEGRTWGVDGETGNLVDMKEFGIWDAMSVRIQTLKTAIETAILLLRIDNIVSGSKKQAEEFSGSKSSAAPAQPTGAGDE